jgi:uncharacterized protein (TIGR00255 family)
MTGFGRGEADNSNGGIGFSVEISTVNRKQFELRVNLPREISGYEQTLRKMISSEISRGFVSVRVELNYSTLALQKKVKINDMLAMSLVSKCRWLQSRLELDGRLDIGDVLKLPGVVETETLNCNDPELEKSFIEAVKSAIKALMEMRLKEGSILKKDLQERISGLETLVQKIRPFADKLPGIQREKLLQRFKDFELPVDADDERLLKEVVVFSDKSDVSEELTRLESHFEHFRTFINEKYNPIGRSMDFLIQEMNREITTLGNKAGSSEVSPLVVEFKTGLEKIREQVQNIE